MTAPVGKVARISVVIPAYDEETTIAQVVDEVRQADLGGLELEIVVVDDGSRDRTREVVERIPGIKVVVHEKNAGKGAAVKTGFRSASGQVLVIQDADMEYDPRDIKAVIAPIVEGRADAVMGSRFAQERPRFFFGKRRSPFFTHYIGNLAIIQLTNWLYWNDASDYEGAYKAFRKEAVDSLPIEADGFEYDNELVCKLLRRGARIVTVPISYQPRSYEQGKKVTWTDGVRMLWTIVKWRVKPF